MRRKRSRKPKIVIKTRNGGFTKLYVNGKWQGKVTDIDFRGYVSDDGITIECEYEKLKCDKNDIPIVVNNELVKDKHNNENGKCKNEEKRKECMEVSRKVLCSDVTKNVPVKAKQTDKYYFEVTMLDGSVRKFYRSDIKMHYIVPNDPNPKITFNLIEI